MRHVAGHTDAAVALHGAGFVHPYSDHLVVEDGGVHVLLGLDEDFLRAGLIFEAEFVEACAAFGTAGFDGAFGLLAGQRIGDGLGGVVDAAGDERPIGVAFEKADHDFLADAGQKKRSPLLAGPSLGHADPAGTLLIVLAELVPMELHDDAAVLIGPDLLAGFAHHGGGLGAVNDGARGDARRAVNGGGGDGLEGMGVETILVAVVGNPGEQVFGVGVVTFVAGEGELIAGAEGPAVTRAADLFGGHFERGKAEAGAGFAIAGGGVEAGVL